MPTGAGGSSTICGGLAIVLMATCAAAQPAHTSAGPAHLVYVRDVDPSIAQDMRYAGAANFTGAKVPGYDAPECLLTRAAAEALSRVQGALVRQGLSLKVYDCYRPRRAVEAFVEWTRRPASPGESSYHYPRTRRSQLIALGYIANVSGHSRGDTVDLTIVRRQALATNSRGGPALDCTAPADSREPDDSVDMGTAFDCFDLKSYTASPDIADEQRRWRELLVRAMERAGFRNYRREWWHFTYGDGTGPSFDLPITPRPD